STADNVTVDDVVDARLDVTNVSADLGGSASESSTNHITGSLGTLAAGATWTITVTYSVPSATDTSTIGNTATGDSDEMTPTTGSDSVDVTENVVLAVTKEFADNTVTAGDPNSHTFTIKIKNN